MLHGRGFLSAIGFKPVRAASTDGSFPPDFASAMPQRRRPTPMGKLLIALRIARIFGRDDDAA